VNWRSTSVRLPKDVHDRLARQAKVNNRSLHGEMLTIIKNAVGSCPLRVVLRHCSTRDCQFCLLGPFLLQLRKRASKPPHQLGQATSFKRINGQIRHDRRESYPQPFDSPLSPGNLPRLQ